MTTSEIITTVIASLALIMNAVYVGLTFMMLRAMRRDSLREHRLRHLDDIKAAVLRPLLAWMESGATAPLEGRQAPLMTKVIGLPRPDAPVGDTRLEMKRHLEPEWHPPSELKSGLFKHVKERHFPEEMTAIEDFEKRARQFLTDIAALGRDCANRIAEMTNLQRADRVAGGSYIDSDRFVAGSFKDLLCGLRPQAVRADSHGSLLLLTHGCGDLANGPRDAIEEWWQKADTAVMDCWSETDFAARARQLLAEARAVTERIRALEFTYDLRDDCEYVGGNSRPIRGDR